MGLIFLGVLAVLGLFGVLQYNKLVVLSNRVDNAWHQIDVQLRRRYDLIPNLVETVKGYVKHERETLEAVVEARSKLVQAEGVQEQAEANNLLTQTLRSLFAVAEAYPDLKANQNFLHLQEELSGTESKIAFARQFYNDIVMRFNTAIRVFPTNIIANMMSLISRDYFEAEDEARDNVEVKF